MFKGFREAVARGDRCAQAVGESCQRLCLVSSLSVCSAASSVNPAPSRSASWCRRMETSRGRGGLTSRPSAASENSRGSELGIDGQVTQILDTPHHFFARWRIDFASDDLAGRRDSAIAELRHWLRP